LTADIDLVIDVAPEQAALMRAYSQMRLLEKDGVRIPAWSF
jgi:hypothetical protein